MIQTIQKVIKPWFDWIVYFVWLDSEIWSDFLSYSIIATERAFAEASSSFNMTCKLTVVSKYKQHLTQKQNFYSYSQS